jgi:hypothetical protein
VRGNSYVADQGNSHTATASGVQKSKQINARKSPHKDKLLRYGRLAIRNQSTGKSGYNRPSKLTMSGPGERRTTKKMQNDKKGRKKRRQTSSEKVRDATAGGYES